MAKLNLPPTKSSLIKVRAQHEMAQEGFELLEQKREILVMELMKRVEQLKLLEGEMEKKYDRAYGSLKSMLLKIGIQSSQEISKGIKFDFKFKERTSRVIGLPLPALDIDIPKMQLQYSFLNTYALCDKTMIEFFELLKLIANMASIRTAVWRLAREVKKTQRRVNALEKIVIPDARETMTYIEAILEEKERESFFVKKMVKARLAGESK